jgi:hypothetical protein
MSHEPTEHEIIERLIDAVRSAADCLSSACRRIASGVSPRPATAVDLLRHLRQASGCAGQLVHVQRNPQFLEVRDGLEDMATLISRVAFYPNPRVGVLLAQYGSVLDRLWRSAKAMAEAKSMPNQDVLDYLANRKSVLN